MTEQGLTGVSLALVGAIILLIITEIVNRGKRPANYIDHASRNKVFYSVRYGISAKPDAILDGTTIEEFKSRKKGMYSSDRIQLIATALAVRSQYPITQGKLITQQTSHDVDLSGSDEALFSKIKNEHHHASLIANGIAPPPSPAKGKCRTCEFRNLCEYRVN